MRESQEIMIKFVKIVERFPVLYDNKLPLRTKVCMEAWEKVVECVKNELKEDCTVEEARIKWKGVRSSFTRFKKKLHLENREPNSKQYYLYDSLKFLHAHTRPKWSESQKEDNQNDSENEDGWVQNITIKALKGGTQSTPIKTYGNTKDPLAIDKKGTYHTEAKVEVTEIKTEPLDDYVEVGATEVNSSPSKRKAVSDANEAVVTKIIKTENAESTDLQFFKSIIPDIAHFTTQEKRSFKMGVLQLIDDIEESRKLKSELKENENLS